MSAEQQGPPLALEENLALLAGAGAGKTHGLITLCLHLLGGARRRGGPLPPARLCLVTFTDKAADELRHRLRQRVERLAVGAEDLSLEPELRAGFVAAERPFPRVDFWQQVLSELGAASVGTFHALCMQLLRRAPVALEAVPPGFELLEDPAARALLEDCAERVVLEALDAGDEGAALLTRELDFRGYFEGGLTAELVRVHGKLREEGLSPRAIAHGDEARAHADFARALEDVRVAAREAESVALATPGINPKYPAIARELRELFEGIREEGFGTDGRFAQVTALFKREPHLLKGGGAAKEPFKRVKYRALGDGKDEGGLAEAHGAIQGTRMERAFVGLLEKLAERVRAEHERLGVLDFAELILRARDVLRDAPAYRAQVQRRFGTLLVDEFQDTNRLQLELVMLLAEERAGAPRAVAAESSAVLGLPLEPGFLCVVGDRKQSIYEFRGADVSVFGQVAELIVAQGGERGFLQHNRRSVPGLLSFFNGTFAALLQPPQPARDYEVHYQPAEDDLLPVRKTLRLGAVVERLVLPEPTEMTLGRQAEADALAVRLRELLAPGASALVDEGGELRPPRGSDVALLFRTFSSLEIYRAALIRRGVPHRVLKGRGFYGASEVLDLASLFAWLADPRDRLSLAAVLRSPLVGLTDASLFRLALERGGRLEAPAVGLAAAERKYPLPSREQEQVERLWRLAERLRPELDRLGVRGVLAAAIAGTDLRVRLAATPFAEQALANLDKLGVLAERWDDAGRGDLASFAQRLLALANEEPREAQADALDLGDPRAVQLLTIHAAKGLEWPIVCVPDLGTRPRSVDAGGVVFDRELGLAARPRGTDGKWMKTPRARQILGELRRRESAESGRLLYVALTRARDRLILSGQPVGKGGGPSWRAALDPLCEGELRRMVTDVTEDLLTFETPAREEMAPVDRVEAREQAEQTLQRVRWATTMSDDSGMPLARSPALEAGTSGLGGGLFAGKEEDEREAPQSAGDSGLGVASFKSSLQGEGEDERDAHDLGEAEGHGATKRGRHAPAPVGLDALDDAERCARRFELIHRTGWEERGSPFASLSGARRRGAEALKAAVRQLAGGASENAHNVLAALAGGWDRPAEVAALEQWVKSPLAAQLTKLGQGRVHAGLPLRLDGVARVQDRLDLLFEDEEGGATAWGLVISAPHPLGLTPYRARVAALAESARAHVKAETRLRVGLVFLWPEGCEVMEASGDDLDRHRGARTLAKAWGSVEAIRVGREAPAGIPRARCQSLGCGFVGVCWGAG